MSTIACGGNAIELSWQWPHDRAPVSVMKVEITRIAKLRSGLFGLGRSPSLVNNLPEATEIEGRVRLGGTAKQSIRLVLPGPEIPSGLKAGDLIDLQLLDDQTCIGLLLSKPEEHDLGTTP